MNRKILAAIVVFIGSMILIFTPIIQKEKKDIVVMTASALMQEMSLDDIIKESDIIVIGSVTAKDPAQWKMPDGKKIKDATPGEIFQAEGLFTDSIISVNRALKGDNASSIVRVRSFVGETEGVRWINDNEPSLQKGQSYLLFLSENYGSSRHVEPGSYISVNAFEGVYEIKNDRAVSRNDEWLLDDLISYIQEVLSTQPAVNIPETPDTKEIMRRVESLYDIESEAAYSFDLSKFPTIFMNEARYSLNPESLEFVKMATDNPSLETAGYLDYKTSYFTWWKEGVFRSDAIREKAAAENRNITDDELSAFLASKWGNVPGHIADPARHFKIKFSAITVDGKDAIVVIDFGEKTKELFLILVDGNWYVAGDSDITLHP